VTIALTSGAIWLVTRPSWVIYDSSQIQVDGNELLSSDMVQRLLPMEYPQTLWEVDTEAIARGLEASGPIAEATITRQLFPPSLMLQVQERKPVAVAQDFIPDPEQTLSTVESGEASQPTPQALSQSTQGLLDSTGAWFPLENYLTLGSSLQVPDLTVVGMNGQNRSQWSEMYQEITQINAAMPTAPRIAEIDWRNPSNVILRTDVGTVHIGAFTTAARFSAQLRAIAQIRNLPNTIERSRIAHIDVTNPNRPMIQLIGFQNALDYSGQSELDAIEPLFDDVDTHESDAYDNAF
jgi:cell division protein FtsQ